MKRNGKRLVFHTFGLLILLLGLACKGGNDSGPGRSKPSPSYTGNYHPAGWVAAHPGQALSDLNKCKQCHEMGTLRVGSEVPSCMTAACHHNSIPGWAVPGNHGLKAKSGPDASGGGLISCQMCHGNEFNGGLSSTSCASCHGVKAPHPPKPWRAPGLTHASTDPANAPVCAQCHFPGSANNPQGHPAAAAPAGTAPGCFNNTMCHGASGAPHILGPLWKEATSSAFHGLEAKKDLAYCQSCHGTPGTTAFDGGAASTKCSSCHVRAKAHSDPWHDPPVSSFPGYVPSHRNALRQSTSCTLCHDVAKGRTAPNPSAPSCFSASFNGAGCHANGPGAAAHPVPFLDPAHFGVDNSGFSSSCATCHAVNGSSPVPAAPLCTACHQAASPLTVSNCASCHAKPPLGASFPNVAGRHAKHEALPGVTGLCATCHAGADSQTQVHYDHANGRPGSDALRVAPGVTSFLGTFTAKGGAASFDPAGQTCSNVSCHGGIKTPSWQNGSIDSKSEAGCRQCHTLGTAQGVPENNSPFSGLHALHLGSKVNAQCVDCHAMDNGTAGSRNHFSFLNTPQLEGPASDTIAPKADGASVGSRAYYQPGGQTCGTFTCHGQLHGTFSWSGQPVHDVPFLQPAHTAAKQADFDSVCSACHGMTGTSTNPKAPLCTTCHQAGSPLTTPNCASCHQQPPMGTAFPNLAGKHAQHAGMTGNAGDCTACHSGADSGTMTHYDHANARPGKDALRVPPGVVKGASVFNSKGGALGFDAASQTCSNVSCHGGIRTPSWISGSLDVLADAGCRQCHSLGSSLGTPENNSLFSGMHALHLGTTVNALCTDCHGMGNGTAGAANHFKSLDTAQMEGPASDTVQPLGNRAYYQPQGQTCGTFTCHGQLHGNFGWVGGAAHAVPFRDAGHTTVTPAQFTATCATCHVYSGTSPMGSAPTCNVCHKLADPTAATTGVGSCLSCHVGGTGLPLGPTGTSFPSVAGTHASHLGLKTALTCNSCHLNVGAGSTAHYDGANYRTGTPAAPVAVAISPTFQAQTGGAPAATAVADPTCSNVSCHGGQVTPAWRSGTLNVNTQCTSCHAPGTTQYNSYNSGQHPLHMGGKVNALCTDCHSLNTGRTGANNHFSFLGTPAMEGPAKDTVAFSAAVTASPQFGGPTYTPGASAGRGNCALSCHGQDHQNESW